MTGWAWGKYQYTHNITDSGTALKGQPEHRPGRVQVIKNKILMEFRDYSTGQLIQVIK
jgi:hypothetical protein